MNEGDKVLVKSTVGAPDLDGVVTRVWSDQFVRVAVVRPSPIDELQHHDEIDVPVAEAVDGYEHYAVASGAAPAPAPVAPDDQHDDGGN